MSKPIPKNLLSFNNSGANEDEEKEGKDDGDNDDTFTLRTRTQTRTRRRCSSRMSTARATAVDDSNSADDIASNDIGASAKRRRVSTVYKNDDEDAYFF